MEALHELFPQAPIFTAYFDPKGFGPHRERVKGWQIKTSWLQKLPLARKLISPLRVLAPLIFEGFDLSEYDLVISSCNSYFAKAVITKPQALHLSYIHTPPRYLYGYTTSFNYKKHWWTRLLAETANHFLRIYDFETSQRPDVLIANSKNVAERIKKFYRRESKLIYPPVEVSDIKKQSAEVKKEKDFFLSLGRLVRGKGTETIVKAVSDLNLLLKVVGAGLEKERLKKIAGKCVQFIGEVSDAERVKLLSSAKALIVASEDEDFGITAVEAQAAGTSVIAVGTGGYLETVLPGKTGEFFAPGEPNFKRYIDEQAVKNLKEVLQNFDYQKYKAEDCQKQAEKFSKEKFKEAILKLVKSEAERD